MVVAHGNNFGPICDAIVYWPKISQTKEVEETIIINGTYVVEWQSHPESAFEHEQVLQADQELQVVH